MVLEASDSGGELRGEESIDGGLDGVLVRVTCGGGRAGGGEKPFWAFRIESLNHSSCSSTRPLIFFTESRLPESLSMNRDTSGLFETALPKRGQVQS